MADTAARLSNAKPLCTVVTVTMSRRIKFFPPTSWDFGPVFITKVLQDAKLI